MLRNMLSSLIVGTFFMIGCLPGDTRPEPARIYVTAEAADTSINGFTTEDGWSIHFERLLTSLGNVSLAGDACNEYSGSGYDRLYDFTLPGAQKLGEAYGLGSCEIRFRLRPPSDDALLQNGVTAADREFMREVTIPEEIPQLPIDGPVPRTGVYVRGMATRGAEIKTFEWKFVISRYTLTDCANAEGEKNTFLHLKGGDDLRPVISFHAEELFRFGAPDESKIAFQQFYLADADNDGNITTTELETFDIANPVIMKLSEWILTNSLPRTVYYDGRACSLFMDEGRGPGGGGPF